MKSLLAPPDARIVDNLEMALAAVARAFPLPASHRKDLPNAIRDLSRTLTEDRGELARPYWAAPRLFAAYLRFFLPWNLYRLAWLLPGLDLPLRDGARLLDLGSGPLTLPLALWCARPDLRGKRLEFVCNDLAMQPMERGREIFTALAGIEAPWRFSLLRGPLEKALGKREEPPFEAILCANTLNELAEERARPGRPELERRLALLTTKMVRRTAPEGRIFLLEPGTRLGGKIIALVRRQALALGCAPLAPCPHALPCPMLPDGDEGERARRAPLYTGWCHFTHTAASAPAALQALSLQARMHKRGFALSCLLLERPKQLEESALGDEGDEDFFGLDELEKLYQEIMGGDTPETDKAAPRRGDTGRDQPTPAESGQGPMPTRVVSAAIALPGEDEGARYSCCRAGLGLLLHAAKIPSGSLVTAEQRGQERDAKTGAILLQRVREEAWPTDKAPPSPNKARPAGKTPPPIRKVAARKPRGPRGAKKE
jgi:hypothetical protein